MSQLGNIDELVVGGYHAFDCVKRVGEAALDIGINTMVDLDMTDLFFSLYGQEEYFNIGQYNPKKYKEYFFSQADVYEKKYTNQEFNKLYSSLVYGFNEEIKKRK